MRLLKLMFLFLTLFSFSACTNQDKSSAGGAKPDILFTNLDTTVSPAQDFFQYANGGWIKNNPIPSDVSSWGIGNLVNEENLKRFKEINEKSAAANAAKGTPDQKIGDFWKTAMDSAKIEEQGLKPLQPWFDKINAVTDVKSLVTTVAELKKIGSSTLFADFINQDSKNSEEMTYTLWQGGIGLGQREYYFRNDSSTINIRNEYVKHIAKILSMSGQDSVSANSDAKNI
ncbi:MAG: M13 family metallopeptidase N-terminal domain-containing protein, partial [Bacteroidota bacterium]